MTVRPLLVTTGAAEPVKVTPGSTTGVPTIRTKARPVGSESTTTADGVVPRGKSTVSSNVASSPITPCVLELNESTIDVLTSAFVTCGACTVTVASSERPAGGRKLEPPSVEA